MICLRGRYNPEIEDYISVPLWEVIRKKLVSAWLPAGNEIRRLVLSKMKIPGRRNG